MKGNVKVVSYLTIMTNLEDTYFCRRFLEMLLQAYEKRRNIFMRVRAGESSRLTKHLL